MYKRPKSKPKAKEIENILKLYEFIGRAAREEKAAQKQETDVSDNNAGEIFSGREEDHSLLKGGS